MQSRGPREDHRTGVPNWTDFSFWSVILSAAVTLKRLQPLIVLHYKILRIATHSYVICIIYEMYSLHLLMWDKLNSVNSRDTSVV